MLAERDANYRTPRDVAEGTEGGALTINVAEIDEFVSHLVARGESRVRLDMDKTTIVVLSMILI